MHDLITQFDIPVIKTYDFDFKYDVNDLVDMVRPLESLEGVVVAFEDGHRVKIKADQYVRIHKMIDMVSAERHVINLFLNNELDDIIPQLDAGFKEKVDNDVKRYLKAHKNCVERISEAVDRAVNEFDSDKKRIALELVPELSSKADAKIIFGCIDGKGTVKELVDKQVEANLNREVRYQETVGWMEIR